MQTRPSGDPNGVKDRRPWNGSLECKECPKIPPGAVPHPANAVEPGERAAAAVRHYRECRAVNWQVPDTADPLVRRRAALIRMVEDAAEKAEANAVVQLLTGLGLSKKGK